MMNENSKNMARLYTEKEAAIYLGLSRHTLKSWRRLKKGPAYVKMGGAVRYDVVDLGHFISERLHINTGS